MPALPCPARRTLLAALALSPAAAAWLPATARAQSAARVDDSANAKELDRVPRKAGARPTVAIYEFRSVVPEVQVGAAREMFVTALIRSGAFAVAERQRLAEGVMRERQLAQSGVTAAAPAAQGQITAARYVFEVVVSEANAGASESSRGVTVGGMQVSGGATADQIGLDVRIVDTHSGMVVDAVNVVKKLESATTNVSGVGNLLNSIASLRGKSVPVQVDAESRSSRKESVDRALRACIEAAVAELARRLQSE
jgi:curli biogenesis system outer membrane secretion channel CsgG